ncbi:MAG: sugar ABC transporter permease [Kiritimatiellae bacterium]|nr:sugar ABC transporter permease [Kiritimatiellia bacterium]
MNVEKIKLRNLSQNWVIFLMMAPTLIGVAIFSYGPAIEAIRHSVYNWDGAFTEEYTGLQNFRMLFGNLSLWTPLLLGGLLTFIAGVLAERKYLNKILKFAGIGCYIVSAVLMTRDAMFAISTAESESMRIIPAAFRPIWVMTGLFITSLVIKFKGKGHWASAGNAFCYIIPFIAGVYYLTDIRKIGDWLLWKSFNLIFILIAANLLKMWPAIFAAVCIHRLKSEHWQYLYRVLFVIPMIIPQMVGLLVWKFFYDSNVGILNKFLIATGLDNALIWLDKWVLHLGVFIDPFKPAWLGHPDLIIPSLLFWGFPWVGVVGVLIYLSGLQNISQDVYEAAELDGIGTWGKFTKIELPLIMTQVRLNLVLMIIGTLQAYGFQLVLLGPEGGPQNKGLTPGLYMFYESFLNQNYGYACAIGLMLFFIILFLTVINQRYVRVDK